MKYMWNLRKRDRDWYLDFEPEIQKMNGRVGKAIRNNHTAGAHFPMDFANMLSQILNFLLFGSVISLLHPVIIVLLAIGCVLNYFMSEWVRKKNWSDRDIRNDLDKKIDYSTFGMSRNFKYAKDVRLYNMQKPLHERLEKLFALRLNEQKKQEWRVLLNAIENFLVVLVRDAAAYAFLIYKAVQGEVDASSFVLYFSAITSMSAVMGKILGTINRVSDGAMQVSDFREGLEVPDRLNRGEGIPTPKGPFSIEFKNVSFKYPKGEKKILDNVSFRIESGEKIALVGLNGAGKTTLTMLMCGLLMPNEGEILLDGHPLTDYNRDEVYALFGFVPQDYHLLPISIARNIASAMPDDEIDRKKLEYCIKRRDLPRKLHPCRMGLNLYLTVR